MKQLLYKVKKIIPDKFYISLQFYHNFKKWPNIERPKTFNEKLQWLKLYDRNPEYTKMVDKITAKDYVKSIIGEEYIIPTLKVWERVEDIRERDLPERFVMKTNHDSKGVIVCSDKHNFNLDKAKKFMRQRLKHNAFWYGREWPYKDILPKVFIEEFLESEDGDLKDYKVFCFNGKAKFTLVCSDRFSDNILKEDFYDNNWNKMNIARLRNPNSDKKIEKPSNLDLMLKLANTLSRNIPFVRVDFYEVKGKLYFGELTLYPASGYSPFADLKWDYILGSYLTIPTKRRKCLWKYQKK